MSRIEKFMEAAVSLSARALEENAGGPFGCVIVKGEEIVGSGYNRVVANNDPTAHAEVVAIRDACRQLNTFQLTDCEIFSSCEPCPMCLGAIYWARPKAVYFANSRTDAAAIGFDDRFIYEELAQDIEQRKIPFHHCNSRQAKEVFEQWSRKEEKAEY